VAFRLSLTAWLAAACYFEHKRRRIPNWLTLPGMAASIGWGIFARMHASERLVNYLVVAAAIWFAIYLIWGVFHWFAAGDAKLLMVLFALFPHIKMFWTLCGTIVVVGGIVLLRKYRGKAKELKAFYQSSLLSRKFGPTREELLKTGDFPLTYPIALGGVVHAWLLA